MKGLLTKIGKPHPLTTLLTEAEASLKNQPLLSSESLSPDRVPMTPGHFSLQHL